MARPLSNRKCSLEHCEKKHFGLGYCQMHYQRQRNGLPLEAPKRGDIEYRAAHYRVEKARGKARTYFCTDCSGQAAEWSLSPTATDVMISKKTGSDGKAFSLDIYDYEPRCVPCHRRMDISNLKGYAA